MITKGIIEEDFVNYKKPSMVIMFPHCNFKCNVGNTKICQNSVLTSYQELNIENDKLCERYLLNPITQAIVCSGLDPMDSFEELYSFIYILRYEYKCYDDIIIYTGYTEEECKQNNWLQDLIKFKNIIIKFGRFIPNQTPHYDNVLGIKLASDNQYAKVIS